MNIFPSFADTTFAPLRLAACFNTNDFASSTFATELVVAAGPLPIPLPIPICAYAAPVTDKRSAITIKINFFMLLLLIRHIYHVS